MPTLKLTVRRENHKVLTQLRDNLAETQSYMKKYANLNRTEWKFNQSDWIYVKLQSYRQISISKEKNQELAPKYYGPFEVEE
jgi:hypothetical protein